MGVPNLRRSLEQLCGPVSERQMEQLSEFVAAIERRGARAGLMSARALEEVEEHVIDSAAVLSVRRLAGERVADVGSGGGFPGIVLSILEPTAEVTVIEAVERKASFLKGVVRRGGLTNVTVVHCRAEALTGRAGYTTVVARAVGPIEQVLPACMGLVAKGGRVVLYKGPSWRQEEASARAAAGRVGAEIGEVRAVALPDLGRSTVFVEVMKVREDRQA